MNNLTRKHHVNTRLNDIEMKKLQNFAQENGIGISEAIRILIQQIPKQSD